MGFVVRRAVRPMPERLSTPRLVLRTFRGEDMAGVVPLIGDREVARWLTRVPQPYTPVDAGTWVALCHENRAAGRALDLLAVRHAPGTARHGRPMGGVGLSLETAELGYWLGRPYHGRGFAGEMVGAMLRWAFTQGGLPAVWARTMPDNAPSQRLLKRLGFVGGGRVTGHHYDLSADRWRTLSGGARS